VKDWTGEVADTAFAARDEAAAAKVWRRRRLPNVPDQDSVLAANDAAKEVEAAPKMTQPTRTTTMVSAWL
jgi:hypothetical protein